MSKLFDKLLYNLSRPPARRGLRLRGERELAEILGAHPQSIRYAMNQLADGGWIEKRRNAGCFVRRTAGNLPGRDDIPRLDIFAPAPSGEWLVESDCPLPPLEIALWGYVGEQHLSEALLRDGIRDRLEAEGHHLTVFRCPREARRAEDLRAQYEEAGRQFDAFLAFSCVAAPVIALGQKDTPTLFIQNVGPMLLDPSAGLDVHTMFDYAGLMLSETGFKRVGYLGIRELYPEYSADFRRVCGVAGLEIVNEVAAEPSFNDAEKALALLFPADRRELWPEAIFVSDDILLRLIYPFMLRAGIRPGVEVGVLSLAIAGSELPGGLDWSTVEFSTYHLGRRCAESILSVLCRTGEASLSFRLLPRINPGRTLQLRRTPSLSCKEK